MRRAMLLIALASAALPQMAAAQSDLQAGSITMRYQGNPAGCAFTAPSIGVRSSGSELRLNVTNNLAQNVSFTLSVALSGPGLSRSFTVTQAITLAASSNGGPSIRNISPALPTSLSGVAATVTINNCAVAPLARPQAFM